MWSRVYEFFLNICKPGRPFASEYNEEDLSLKEAPPPPPPEPNEVYEGIKDGAIWNCPIGRHATGEFSVAVVQANIMIEDYSHVESTPSATFVGVYDGHGGTQAASYVSDHLYSAIRESAEARGGLSPEVFTDAFAKVEEGFLEVVRENWKTAPVYAAVGSCALVGVVDSMTLYVASLGDSRAVVGTTEGAEGDCMKAVEVSQEHNASDPEIRKEVLARCPDDPHILMEKGGVWRVKGIIQVARSFGDFYLKHQEFQCPPLYTKFRLAEELTTPALTYIPSVLTRTLTEHDKFVIFATDGLWENVSSEEAVHVVLKFPRKGIARRLVKLAMIRAGKKRKLTYSELKLLGPGRRRQVHDDISIVVLFLDHVTRPRGLLLAPLCLKSFEKLPVRTEEDGEGEKEEDVRDDFEITPLVV